MTRHDPGLSEWFEQHCSFQEVLRAKIRQIQVPGGLKEQIISERKARLTLAFRRKVTLTAVAATVLILGFLSFAHFSGPGYNDRTFAAFQTNMLRKVLREYPTMDLVTNNLDQIHQYLAQNGPHGDYVLPKHLQNASGTGCAIFPWHGKKVSMICLNSGKTKPATDPDLFLFVIDRTAVPDAPTDSTRHISQVRNLLVAVWTSGNET